MSVPVALRSVWMVYDHQTEFRTATPFESATHPRIQSLLEMAYADLQLILVEFYIKSKFHPSYLFRNTMLLTTNLKLH